MRFVAATTDRVVNLPAKVCLATLVVVPSMSKGKMTTLRLRLCCSNGFPLSAPGMKWCSPEGNRTKRESLLKKLKSNVKREEEPKCEERYQMRQENSL